MRQRKWWIDDAGRWRFVDPDSQQPFRRRPFERHHETFAYRWMRSAKVCEAGRRVQIRFDLNALAPAVIDSIDDYLNSVRHVDLVRLGVFFEGWNIEDHAGPVRARMRFHEVLQYRGVKPATTITLRELPIGEVATAAPLLRAGLRAWHESGGALDRLSERDRALSVHAAVMGRQARSDDLAFIHLGAKSGIRQALGRDWASKAEGRSYRDAVELPAYRNRVSQAYERVLGRNEPHFDHIRALLHPPRGEPIWVAYQRLLTPYRSRSRGDVVMCLSAITQNIAIPFMSTEGDA